jgi:NAD-dependent deacetylase
MPRTVHLKAGNTRKLTIEIHGSALRATCLDCGAEHDRAGLHERILGGEVIPTCDWCAGRVKPATISFGQAMPERQMRRAEQLTLDCDLFLAVGSSLVVWPAAGFPLLAKRNGARLVIINREATEFDEIADLVVREDIGTVLSPFIVH